MKKTPSRVREVRAEYDFSGGVRGKYAKRFAPLLAAVLVFGCSDPLSPTDVAGRYQLQRVQNAPLPFVLPSPADRMQRLLSGHLLLSADGSAEEVMLIEQPSGPGATVIVVQRTALVYELDGARVTISVPRTPCPAVACTLPATYTRTFRFLGDALVETDGLHYVRSEITTQ